MLMDNDSLWQQLQLNAQQYIQQHHNPEHEKQQYVNIINEVLRVTDK